MSLLRLRIRQSVETEGGRGTHSARVMVDGLSTAVTTGLDQLGAEP